ncbi:MAG: hypothetical protein IJS04_02220 [Muribaculaceae bacterium]|nr:hypothetical protein [Muribaculaceae bacterium]
MRQLSPALRQRTTLVLQEFGDRDQFMKRCSPLAQLKAGRNPKLAIMSEKSPTLVVLKKAYGENFPVMWLMEQILELVVYSNSKGTLNDYQAEFLANTIVNEYYDLKSSELLLFFYQFKCGKYGHFYGTIDPMRITIALDEFYEERNRVIERHQRAEEERLESLKQKQPTVSPEEWCRQTGLPECHTAIEVYRMRDRIINFIEALVYAIGRLNSLAKSFAP